MPNLFSKPFSDPDLVKAPEKTHAAVVQRWQHRGFKARASAGLEMVRVRKASRWRTQLPSWSRRCRCSGLDEVRSHDDGTEIHRQGR